MYRKLNRLEGDVIEEIPFEALKDPAAHFLAVDPSRKR